ncbi:MAG: hypothetical protein CMD81_00945 [Gammaproteobacteria bacterium]|nr:hypothetical protein [Gammaproteobacteria bacterium]|tara:strand:- start:78 stop:2768 length:2691 start_codon:yes stop_codon:yes gene_type:complete
MSQGRQARSWFHSQLHQMAQQPDQIITPNQRLALFLSRDWAQQESLVHDVWAPLAVCPWGTWLSSLWQGFTLEKALLGESTPVLLTHDEQVQLWQSLAAEHAEAALEADQLARIWGLVQEPSGCNDHQLQQKKWQEAYAALKQKHQYIDQIDMLKMLMQAPDITQRLLQHKNISSLLFYGFIEYTPLQEAFIAVLKELNIKCILGLDQQLQAKPVLHEWTDVDAELYGAAQWARRRWFELAAQPEWSDLKQDDLFNGPRIAVVIPDLAQHQEVVRSVFYEVLQWQGDFEAYESEIASSPWTLSAGQPMADYPLLSLLLHLLDLTFFKVAQVDLEYILSSEHWAENAGAVIAPALLSSMRQQGRLDWQLQDVRTWLLDNLSADAPAFQVLLPVFDQLLKLRQAFAFQQLSWHEWLDIFLDTIDVLLWPGKEELNSENFQLIQRWHSWWLAQEEDEISLNSALEQSQKLTYLQAIGRIRKSWRETMFQPEASTDRILVLGLLEAAALPLDDVYITGLSASQWPANSQPNPFLPYEEQRKHQVPRSTPVREIWYGEALLKLYAKSTSSLNLSYPASVDDVPQFLSPLVFNVFGQLPPQQSERHIFTSRMQLEWIDIDESLEPLQGKQALKSATSGLQMQAYCPFLGALALRAGIRIVDPAKVAVSGADRGSWMHRVLELLWQDWSTPNLMLQNRKQVMPVVKAVLEKASQSMPALMTPVMLEVEMQRLYGLVMKSIDYELEREAFVVEATEQKVRLNVFDFEFDLRLDRWDRQGEKIVLIDYKSSPPSVSDQRLIAPQLILYALSIGQILGLSKDEIKDAIAEAVYFAVRPSKGVEWCNLAEDDGWFEQDFNLLSQALTEVRAGYAVLEPLEGERTCNHCQYQSYCRVQYRREEEVLHG